MTTIYEDKKIRLHRAANFTPKLCVATFRVRRAEASNHRWREAVKTPPDRAFPPHVQSISSRARRSRGPPRRRRVACRARPRPEIRISLAAAGGSSCDGGRRGGDAGVRWCQKEEAAPPALLAGPRCSPARAACRSEEAPEGGGRAGNRPAPLTGQIGRASCRERVS